ncbi:hypothetical protein NQZ68_040448 [Dissostichus eleginoides]|nr:hypothetical protein NQZ68_040448 [Dissostichus eleginoides]
MQRSVRKRRLGPQQDAEQHIQFRTDKAGLEEHFIDQFKDAVIEDTEESEGEASMSSLPDSTRKVLTKHQKLDKKSGQMKSDYDESASV